MKSESVLKKLQAAVAGAVQTEGRDDFCRRAGVSASTLKNFKDLHEPAGVGAAPLIRLAIACGERPERWLEAFDHDPAAYASKVDEIRRKVRPASEPDGLDVLSRVARAQDRARSGRSGEDQPLIRIGVLAHDPLGVRPLPSFERVAGGELGPKEVRTFCAAYGRRLVGAVFPDLKPSQVGVEVVGEVEHLLKGLEGPARDRRFDMVLGLYQIPSRMRNLRFSTIPGWVLEMDGMVFGTSNGAGTNAPGGSSISWNTLACSPERRGNIQVVTVHKEASWAYFHGDAQYPPGLLVEVSSLAIDSLIGSLADKVASGEVRLPFAFVADEETCDRLSAELKALRESAALNPLRKPFTGNERVSKFITIPSGALSKSSDPRPRYRMTVCVPASEPRLIELLEAAKRTLFQHSAREMGYLYAEVAAECVRESPKMRGSLDELVQSAEHGQAAKPLGKTRPPPPSLWSPLGFAKRPASSSWKVMSETFRTHLRERIRQDLGGRLGEDKCRVLAEWLTPKGLSRVQKEEQTSSA